MDLGSEILPVLFAGYLGQHAPVGMLEGTWNGLLMRCCTDAFSAWMSDGNQVRHHKYIQLI